MAARAARAHTCARTHSRRRQGGESWGEALRGHVTLVNHARGLNYSRDALSEALLPGGKSSPSAKIDQEIFVHLRALAGDTY